MLTKKTNKITALFHFSPDLFTLLQVISFLEFEGFLSQSDHLFFSCISCLPQQQQLMQLSLMTLVIDLHHRDHSGTVTILIDQEQSSSFFFFIQVLAIDNFFSRT